MPPRLKFSLKFVCILPDYLLHFSSHGISIAPGAPPAQCELSLESFGAESGKGWRCCDTWTLQVLLVAGARTSPAAGDNGDIPHRAEPLLCNNGHSLPGQGDTVKRDTSGTGSRTRRRLKRKKSAGCAALPPSTTSCHLLPPPTLPAPLQNNGRRGSCS